MINLIRIGTRSSDLALWQANTVAAQLQALGHKTEIVKIDSIGDEILDKPLYELGITGVFTKNLDIALLNNKIDIAVHSFKDVPTQLPNGIQQAAVLKRGDFNDILVVKSDINFFSKESITIATGSLRRKAQWLNHYPNHKVVGLRGNVNTRLKKLEDNDWDGAIFAKAGLQRLKLLPNKQKGLKLDWMVPAPAQGAVLVAALENNESLLEILKEINHIETAKCVAIERDFLRILEGGCTAPIGALAMIINDKLKFRGVLLSPDGKGIIEYTKELPIDRTDLIDGLAQNAAHYILDRGGKKLMHSGTSIDKEIKLFATKTLSVDQVRMLKSNISVDMSDFITTRENRLKPFLFKKPFKNVVITSQKAVDGLLSNFSPLELDFKNIYCVGKRTKRLIEKKIGKVNHVENSADKLANYLVENLEEREITFFCGNLRRDELPDKLKNNNIKVTEIECYKTSFTPKKIESKYQGILFFSPSAIQSYLRENKSNQSMAFCIGQTTGNEAQKYFENVIVSKLSTVESVIKSVNEYFQQ